MPRPSSTSRPWAALALALVACTPTASTDAPAGGQCDDFELDVVKSWNDETRVALRAEVMHWHGEAELDLAKAHAEQVETSLDSFASDWVRMRKAACLDHFKRQTLDAARYQDRVDCLDQVLLRQRAVIQATVAGEQTEREAFAALGAALDTCAGHHPPSE